MAQQVAVVGGGCFWCTEAIFRDVCGVHAAVSGYMGGNVADPSYSQVCTGTTGHAEVVQLSFDPDQVSYDQLLDIHLATHDPTQLNRQGADVGTQYRSAIFTYSDAQAEAAYAALERAKQIWDSPVVTDVSPAGDFWPAEDYHQDYLKKNPHQPYCMAVVAPKPAKARQKFRHLLKSQAA